MNMAKSKWYVVWVGNKPGIYTSWAECEAQTRGFSGAKYKAYPNEEEAKTAYGSGGSSISAKGSINVAAKYDENSVSVDAACSGNPGIMEYQGVDTKTGERLFHFGPFPVGTNNIGEFLAIVHALKTTKKTIYSDSITALAWVRNKKAASTLDRNVKTEDLWKKIDEAIDWLHLNSYSNQILKWDTKQWGEIKADFGRK